MSKTITVAKTHWGTEYKINTVPVGEKHSKIRVTMVNGKRYDSNMTFTNGDEITKNIDWLKDYTKTNHLYKILDRFKEEILTPFDK